jgi:glutaredoxin 3
MVADLELYGTSSCPYTREMREWLEWTGRVFVEYDVESDLDARRRLQTYVRGSRTVPVLVEAGEVVEIGWQGRGCVVNLGPAG